MTTTMCNSDSAKVQLLAEYLTYKYDELFEELGISLMKTQKFYIGTCPIHCGDNNSALNIYIDGYSVRGYWKCRTHHCEDVFKKTIIGFVRGVLSRNLKGWEKAEDVTKMVSFNETIKWICKFLKVDFKTLQPNIAEIEQKKFIAQSEFFSKQESAANKKALISREQIRSHLQIPAEYFLRRGFSAKILNDYDVGLCSSQGKEMCGRIVVPVYDEDKKGFVACTGRSIYSECKKCFLYHNPDLQCPTNDPLRYIKYSKWRNNSNSNLNSYLYNYWNSKKYIRKTKTVILVEGPPDIWKLEELGIKNAVAMFGVDLTDYQQIVLETSGALSVIILTDMDNPGRLAAEKIKNQLDKSYKVYIPSLSVKDPGELNETILNKELLPIIKEVEK